MLYYFNIEYKLQNCKMLEFIIKKTVFDLGKFKRTLQNEIKYILNYWNITYI